jgi:hypothetical protein
MKSKINICFLLVVAILVLCSDSCSNVATSTSPFTNAQNHLKHFVQVDSNFHLGIDSVSQANSIVLDSVRYAPVNFLFANLDTSVVNNYQIYTTNRRLYPVWSGNKVVSTISFDSVKSGLQDVSYEDSRVIKNFIDKSIPGSGFTYAVVFAPSLESNLLEEFGSHGDTSIIIDTNLRNHMSPFLHNGADSIAFNADKIALRTFLRGVSEFFHHYPH